jgi:predicted house-cleaning noncanonical NTP pyrophosphatase (MazG superfamily)
MMVGIVKEMIYYNATQFLKDCTYEELEDNFEEGLEEYFKGNFKDNFEELAEAIAEHLNSFGWTDEEIITKVLRNREESYLINYVPENHAQEDYFKVLELEV